MTLPVECGGLGSLPAASQPSVPMAATVDIAGLWSEDADREVRWADYERGWQHCEESKVAPLRAMVVELVEFFERVDGSEAHRDLIQRASAIFGQQAGQPAVRAAPTAEADEVVSVPVIGADNGAPQWQTGVPPEGVLLLGHSDHPSRRHKPPELYVWTGKNFQCLIGWFDHAITHWIATSHLTDQPGAESDPFTPKEASGNRQRLAEKAARRTARASNSASPGLDGEEG